jgi:Uncharacterised nucleotidyltransferase
LLEPLLRAPSRWAGFGLAQWDALLRLARACNLTSRVAEQAAPELAQVPPQVAPHLVAALRVSLHQQEAIAWECAHLAQALKHLDVPLVLLKGAAYAMAKQPAAKGRLFGDVDLLVPRASLNAVEAALMVRGWNNHGTDPYDQRYYRRWMHELPPMVHVGRGTVVDVHHNILPLTARNVPDAALLLADSLPIAGTPFRRLSPCDQVLHSATHLYHEGQLRNGLRDLHDLAALLAEFDSPPFWRRLQARAEQLGLVWPLLLALRHTSELLGCRVPAQALQTAERIAGLPRWRLRCLDAVYQQAFRQRLPEDETWARRLALAWLYLRGHALRMPVGKLVLHLGRKAMLRLVKHSSREG